MKTLLTTQNLPARLIRLLIGLAAYGVAIALMIRGKIGASPWDVFGQGLSRTIGLSFGLCTIIISGAVLLLWIPLRQWPGFGTLANAVLVGVFADLGLLLIPQASNLLLQGALFVAGLLLLAFATALYIGAGVGPGPRDGLMTGLVRVSGWPVWTIRTGLELSVVVIGFLLGGVVGIGTLTFAVAVGPLTQLTLRWLYVDLSERTPRGQPEAEQRLFATAESSIEECGTKESGTGECGTDGRVTGGRVSGGRVPDGPLEAEQTR